MSVNPSSQFTELSEDPSINIIALDVRQRQGNSGGWDAHGAVGFVDSPPQFEFVDELEGLIAISSEHGGRAAVKAVSSREIVS